MTTLAVRARDWLQERKAHVYSIPVEYGTVKHAKARAVYRFFHLDDLTRSKAAIITVTRTFSYIFYSFLIVFF